MLQKIVFFALGYGVAKLVENKDYVSKIKKVAQNAISSVKEEFFKQATH